MIKYEIRKMAREIRRIIGGSLPQSVAVARAIVKCGGVLDPTRAARKTGYQVCWVDTQYTVGGYLESYTTVYIGGPRGWGRMSGEGLSPAHYPGDQYLLKGEM